WAMVVYLALKVIDLAATGEIANAFAFNFTSIMFLIELGLGVLVPIIIAFSGSAGTKKGQIIFGLLTVGGVVMNRFNVVMTGMGEYLNKYGGHYFPAWTEFVVSAGLVSIACLLYLFIAENFSILDHRGSEPVKGIMTEDGKYAYFK
ncbi:MAG: hydrogenase, partial [Peptococcaceae bacterium]|nr:hydrogenase [Peptococcaceae bacterium]